MAAIWPHPLFTYNPFLRAPCCSYVGRDLFYRGRLSPVIGMSMYNYIKCIDIFQPIKFNCGSIEICASFLNQKSFCVCFENEKFVKKHIFMRISQSREGGEGLESRSSGAGRKHESQGGRSFGRVCSCPAGHRLNYAPFSPGPSALNEHANCLRALYAFYQ